MMHSLTLPPCHILAVILFAGATTFLQAKDEIDPAKRAEETEMRGKAFLEEAEMVAKRAQEETGALARDLEKFAKLTSQEGKHLLEASEAWSKKQIRRAELAERKAAEICGERGKMLEKVYPKKDKPPILEMGPPTNKSLAPSGKPEKPPAPETGTPKIDPPGQPEKTSTQSALENLEAQSQKLGEE
jgi:hypothetical protein